MNRIYIIVNKKTDEMFTTPKGKWHWLSNNAAVAAYTRHMRSAGIWSPRADDSIPRLGYDGCPYRVEVIYIPFDKENKGITLSIKKEIQS